MSLSNQQLTAYLAPYIGGGLSATVVGLPDGRSAVYLSNDDWSESDASPGVAEAICRRCGIGVMNSVQKYAIIGSYTPEVDEQEAIIKKEFFGQGYIFKDEEAFELHPDKVCYVPERSDATYTRNSLIALCNGQERFARIVFESMDWQYPETYVDEQFANGEWDACPKCGHWFSLWDEDKPPCKKCGAALDYMNKE